MQLPIADLDKTSLVSDSHNQQHKSPALDLIIQMSFPRGNEFFNPSKTDKPKNYFPPKLFMIQFFLATEKCFWSCAHAPGNKYKDTTRRRPE